MNNPKLSFISPVVLIMLCLAQSSFDTTKPTDLSIYWVFWRKEGVWFWGEGWINGPTFGPLGGYRRLEESSLEAPLSISLAALGGGGHDAIDGERLKYGVSLQGWREPALLLLLQIEFYINKRTVSLHLFQFSVILWRRTLFLVFD